MSKGKLLFLATEDWFVRSHFLPLLRRARDDGFDVVVAARSSGALGDVRVVDMPFARGSMAPWDMARQVAHLNALLAREKPAVVHAIALKPMVLLALSGHRLAGCVYALTGRGYLGVRRTSWTQLINSAVRTVVRGAMLRTRSVLLVENTEDRDWLSQNGDLDDRTMIMPGAGVDPAAYIPHAEPAKGPIVIGIVARLIWTKGIDLAVDAVQRLRAQGEDVVLRVAGDIDVESPEAVRATTIERWRSLAGIELLGRVDDVSAFWADAHIACLPSRGGEGLPRSLLEAAACGRPIVTTDAPGCLDFVTDEMGIVVPAEDVDALMQAIQVLAHDDALRASMGAAGRAEVAARHTEDHAANIAAAAWRRVAP